jgi:hypothetical protein
VDYLLCHPYSDGVHFGNFEWQNFRTVRVSVMPRPKSYLIEDLEDIVRLEVKTDPHAVRKQAEWCSLKKEGVYL